VLTLGGLCSIIYTGEGKSMDKKASITQYDSTKCPTCGCVLSVPRDFHYSGMFLSDNWACPQCGLVCRRWLGKVYWTTKSLRLAVNADKHREQRVFDAQERLDQLLKKYPDIGIRFVSGSRTGMVDDNDFVIAEIFANRAGSCCGDDYWKNRIWVGIEDNMWALLITIREQAEGIEKEIKEKADMEADNGADE